MNGRDTESEMFSIIVFEMPCVKITLFCTLKIHHAKTVILCKYQLFEVHPRVNGIGTDCRDHGEKRESAENAC